MGANEKRSLSVSAMSIFLVIFYQLVFNTNHTGATTSLSAQFNFNNNNNSSSSSTYHCNGSVDECLIMDGIDSGLISMGSVRRTRMLGEDNGKSFTDATRTANKPVSECGRGNSYTSCMPKPNQPKPKPHCGIYPNRECPPS